MWLMLVCLVASLAGIAFMSGLEAPNYTNFSSPDPGILLLGPYSMSSGCLTLDIAGAKEQVPARELLTD